VDSAADFARDVWKALSEQTASILGHDVRFSSPEVGTQISVPDRAYVARLEAADGTTVFVVLALEPAIAAASLMLERPEADVKTRLAAGTLESDDTDALGELFNQLAVPLAAAIETQTGRPLSLPFKSGSNDGSEQPRGEIVVRMSCNPGELADGPFMIVVPETLMAVDRAPAMDAGAGFDLSAEEIAALREATREAARGGVTKALVIVPIERDHAAWKDLLDKAGLAHEITGDVSTMLVPLRAGEFDAVIVDADSSPAGGLPMLAKIRAAASGVPAVVVASFPTRTHLIGCLAAGVLRYMTKPLDVQALIDDLGA
jgi:CheY-like chemotaxis protein